MLVRKFCTDMLQYSKSMKGNYNYDIIKIIEESTNTNNKSYAMNHLPKYVMKLKEFRGNKSYLVFLFSN